MDADGWLFVRFVVTLLLVGAMGTMIGLLCEWMGWE